MQDERDGDTMGKFPLRTSPTGVAEPAGEAPPSDANEAITPSSELPVASDVEQISPPAPSVQRAAPADWPPQASAATTVGRPLPVDERPLPELLPLEPGKTSKSRAPRSWPLRILVWIVKAVLIFVIGSVLWVTLYRFVAPPITFTMIGDAVSGHSVNRAWMPLAQIHPNMPRAAIAAEDSGFCAHSGFDFAAIQAAYERNATGTKRIRGGSTISQQTAKNVFLWQGGGYVRKGLEAWFTTLIEAIWGKARIMEVYLNVAETGIGTYGVNAGSQRYFGHDASRMSTQEAAQIAAVLPLPKKRPGSDPTGYTRRYGRSIASRIAVVRNDKLDLCLH